MQVLVLDTTLNYPSLMAYWTTNSFGDQIITLRKEHKNGSVTEAQAVQQEGSHITDKASLLSIASTMGLK